MLRNMLTSNEEQASQLQARKGKEHEPVIVLDRNSDLDGSAGQLLKVSLFCFNKGEMFF